MGQTPESQPAVPNEKQISRAEQMLQQVEQAEKEAKIQTARTKTEKLSGVTEREIREEAKTLSDTYREIPGWVKFLAVIGAGVALWKSNTARVLGGVALVSYVWAKHYGNIDEPVEFAAKKAKPLLGLGSFLKNDISSQDLANRFNVMANFLNANAKETLDSSATAFTLLADVPLSKISRYYSPAGGLDIGNPNFRKEVTAILKDRGMKPNAIDEFFRSCETNKKDVDDALEKTFFYASALEGNDVQRDRASILLAKAKSEGGLTALLKKNPIIEFQGQKIQAQDLYRLLVQQGMTIANEKPKRTLLEFIQNSVMTNGRNPNIPREGLAGKNPSVPQEGNHGVNPNIPGSANTGTNPDVPPSVNVGKNPGVPKKGSSAVQENVNIQENKKGVDPNIPQAQ